jgi:hypothetical protein
MTGWSSPGAVVTASLWEKQRPPRRHVHDDLQRAVMQFLDHALGARGVAYAIPNGGKRHAREAARMKGLGVKPGVPDIGIVVDGGRALFVELKAGRDVMSDAQKDMCRRLTYRAPLLCKRCPIVGGPLPGGVRAVESAGGIMA